MFLNAILSLILLVAVLWLCLQSQEHFGIFMIRNPSIIQGKGCLQYDATTSELRTASCNPLDGRQQFHIDTTVASYNDQGSPMKVNNTDIYVTSPSAGAKDFEPLRGSTLDHGDRFKILWNNRIQHKYNTSVQHGGLGKCLRVAPLTGWSGIGNNIENGVLASGDTCNTSNFVVN